MSTFTVYKYEIPVIDDDTTLEIPRLAQFLDAQVQKGVLCVWYWLDPEQPKESHTFRVIGTGHPAPCITEADYLSTVQILDGNLVFHLFRMR